MLVRNIFSLLSQTRFSVVVVVLMANCTRLRFCYMLCYVMLYIVKNPDEMKSPRAVETNAQDFSSIASVSINICISQICNIQLISLLRVFFSIEFYRNHNIYNIILICNIYFEICR